MGTACCREKGVPDTCFGYCAKEEEVVPFLDDRDYNKELIEDCTFVLSLVLFILGPR